MRLATSPVFLRCWRTTQQCSAQSRLGVRVKVEQEDGKKPIKHLVSFQKTLFTVDYISLLYSSQDSTWLYVHITSKNITVFFTNFLFTGLAGHMIMFM